MQEKQRYSGRAVVLAMLLGALLTFVGGQWFQEGPSSAYAASRVNQVLDAGVQRREMVQEQKNTTKKIDQLIAVLRSGTAKVQIVETKKPTR